MAKTDDELMQLIAKGQTRAFEELFSRYKSTAFGYLCRLMADRERAEDLSQEIWMRVIKYASQYESKGQFKAWLLTLTRNAAFNALRAHKPEETDENNVVTAIDDKAVSQLQWLESQENLAQIKNCFDHLPDQQRQIMGVWLNEELSYDDLAKQLALSLSAVKSQLFRARQNLEKCLGGVM